MEIKRGASALQDIAQLEEVLRISSSASTDVPKEAFFNLTLRNLLGVLVDLKQFIEALARKRGGDSILEQVALHRALQETITGRFPNSCATPRRTQSRSRGATRS